MADFLTDSVKSAYDDFYTNDQSEWRMLGAKYKAQNIIDVCKTIKPIRVLEVGAGDGSILQLLDQQQFAPELYALEIAQSGVDQIQNRNLAHLKEVKAFDGYQIPYEDNSFDLVILSHVLEHVEHERILIRELKRVANYLVIEVPKDYRYGVDQRIKHFLSYGHINMYTPTSLRFLLQSEGLTILADKLSLTDTEITKFNDFVIRKIPKTFAKNLKIELIYRTKKTLGNILGKKKKEQLANAYTVLVKKSDQNIQIF